MSGVLDQIVAAKRAAHAARQPVDLDRLLADAAARPAVRSLRAALRDQSRGNPRAIAEFKRRSPSAGPIRPGADPAEIARAYEAAGAAAISVLTDLEFFDGAPAHLQAARAACALPVIRKDFLLDERDLAEARLLGADAALLIVRILGAERLRALVDAAHQLGLETLVEVHSDAELEDALHADAKIIGVNHRDLDTLKIDLALSARARQLTGPGVVLVGESGIHTRADVDRMRAHQVDAILVGESLMKSPDPGAALRALLA
ncbi:MAG: indole-3-glycerol phosphate synthase TrpC [Polyangia bacterium]